MGRPSCAPHALVSFPVLSQIKPQAPLLVCSSVNSFKFQSCDHTPPGAQTLNGFPRRSGAGRDGLDSIHGRHRLGSGLQRYLISFDPQTFVLDQRKSSSGLLSLLFSWGGSTDFTPTPPIWSTPISPIDHCPAATNETGRGPVPLFLAADFRGLIGWRSKDLL